MALNEDDIFEDPMLPSEPGFLGSSKLAGMSLTLRDGTVKTFKSWGSGRNM